MKDIEISRKLLGFLKNQEDVLEEMFLSDFSMDLFSGYYVDEELINRYLKKFGILTLDEYRKIYKKEAAELAKQDKYDESIQFMKVLNNYKDENKNLLVVKSRFSCDLSCFNDRELIRLLTFEVNK